MYSDGAQVFLTKMFLHIFKSVFIVLVFLLGYAFRVYNIMLARCNSHIITSKGLANSLAFLSFAILCHKNENAKIGAARKCYMIRDVTSR